MATALNSSAFIMLVWCGIALWGEDFPVALFFGMPGGLLFGLTFRRGCILSADYGEERAR